MAGAEIHLEYDRGEDFDTPRAGRLTAPTRPYRLGIIEGRSVAKPDTSKRLLPPSEPPHSTQAPRGPFAPVNHSGCATSLSHLLHARPSGPVDSRTPGGTMCVLPE